MSNSITKILNNEAMKDVPSKVMGWDLFWLDLCLRISKKSKDRSTKLGAIVVSPNNKEISIGWNGFPSGINDDEEYYHSRPTKYQVTAHAEQNAMDNANKNISGWTLYVSCTGVPCTSCTKSIIQRGIKRIVVFEGAFEGKGSHWADDIELAKILLNEVGIELVYYPKHFVTTLYDE